jgi:MarR family transcriptional regulator, transcriptional regulator for hemolysin
VAVSAKSPPDSPAQAPRPLSGHLAWLLARAHHALATELTAALADLGVSPRGYHVLAAALQGDRTQSELAEAVGLDKTTMVVTVDELEAAGLAERHPSSTDRRARVITVTRAGADKLVEAGKVKDRVQTDVLRALPASERKVLIGALQKLVSDRLSEPVPCTPPVRQRQPRA